MKDANILTANSYYKALANKDLKKAESFLHPDILFIAPMGQSKGREAVITAAKRLVTTLKSVDVRAEFSSGDQVVLIYDMVLSGPVERCPTAAFLTIKEGLIARSELFYDARPFGNL